MINTLPNGWSTDQLTALNNLVDLYTVYETAKTIKTLLNDTTPQGAQVMTDLVTMAKAEWATLITYPT